MEAAFDDFARIFNDSGAVHVVCGTKESGDHYYERWSGGGLGFVGVSPRTG